MELGTNILPGKEYQEKVGKDERMNIWGRVEIYISFSGTRLSDRVFGIQFPGSTSITE